MVLLLLSSLWNVQANGKKVRTGNRSDAIMLQLSQPVINYVRPNLILGKDKYAGLADIWNPKKGFLVQSINPESYNLNFPTTGAHNLYFDLLITGIDVRDLTWEPVTHEGITATVTNDVVCDSWIPYEDCKEWVARVKLTGPVARYRWDNPKPSVVKPRLPQTFELVGRDIYGVEVVKYGFVLKQWFIHRGDKSLYYDMLIWCHNIGYHMPRVRDLTNAVNVNGGLLPPVVGASPSSPYNNYMRHIDAGFFSEWGVVDFYKGADFGFNYHLSSEDENDKNTSFMYVVDSAYGDIRTGSSMGSFYVVCVSDLRP